MASNTAPTDGGSNEVEHDHGLVRVYKDGRVERPFVAPPLPAGLDPSTGVDSKDVDLGDYSVRLYLPPAATNAPECKQLPVVFYIHGGGFVAESVGSPPGHRFLNSLAAACPAIAVSVEYRLAPEHPLPAAYEDCLAALRWTFSPTADPWISAHADLARVFVAGDSAGGNICHHIAVQPDVARLRGTVLIHPWFWGSEAVGEETRDPAERAMGCGLWKFACPGSAGPDDPRMNPMAPGAPGLDTLACERVMVCTAEGDFLRWRGRAYAEAVTAARGGGEGQGIELLETDGEGHVFYLFKPDCEKAKEMIDRIVAFVNAA